MEDLEYFKKLALDLKFRLSKEEAEDIKEEFDTLLKQLSLFDDIDTDKAEPMVYPFEEDTYFLREDKADHTLNVSDAFKNAKNVKNGYFIVPRVVK